MTASRLRALDADLWQQVEAKRIVRQARGYKAAYLALDADPAKAAGEVTYEAAALVGQEKVFVEIKKRLSRIGEQ